GWTVRVSEPCVHPRCRVCSFLALCASRRIRRSVLHIARSTALMGRSPRLGFRHRPVEGPRLAAASTDRTTDIALRTASPRVTFAKLGDPIEVPDLLSLQTTSFDWLLGNERWQESAAEASAAGREDVPQTSGPAASPPWTTSFVWLLGNERWQESAAAASAAGREDVPQPSGLADILEEISPIEDFAGNMSLSFRDHTFDDPKYTVDECKEKDLTYAAPL